MDGVRLPHSFLISFPKIVGILFFYYDPAEVERKKNTSKLFDSKNFSSFLLLFIASIRRRLFLARFYTHKMCVLYLFWLSRKSHREQRDGEPTSADFVWFAQSAFSWCFGSKVNSRSHSSWSHFGIFARAVRRFVGRLRFWLLVRELKKNKKIVIERSTLIISL